MYHFIDCIQNDKPHIATGEEGLLVMEILDAMYQSASEGAPVKIA
jgi:predicted dehydrogenase